MLPLARRWPPNQGPCSRLFISTIDLSQDDRQQLLQFLRSAKPLGANGDAFSRVRGDTRIRIFRNGSQFLCTETIEFRATRLAEIAQQVEGSVLNERFEFDVSKRDVRAGIGVDKSSYDVLGSRKNVRR